MNSILLYTYLHILENSISCPVFFLTNKFLSINTNQQTSFLEEENGVILFLCLETVIEPPKLFYSTFHCLISTHFFSISFSVNQSKVTDCLNLYLDQYFQDIKYNSIVAVNCSFFAVILNWGPSIDWLFYHSYDV